MRKFIKWLLKGKIKPTTDIPFKKKGEKFKGFKITWPWPGDNPEEDRRKDEFIH